MNWTIKQKVDLNVGYKENVRLNNTLMVPSNEAAHTIEVDVCKGGQPVSLNGYDIHAYFVRSDDTAVIIAGTAFENVAKVTMNQSCYAYEGVLRCVVFASNETESITLCDLFCTVRSGIPTQIVDPDEVIPDVESLLTIEKKIEAALKNTDSAVANAQELVDTVQKKLDNGQFKGEKGDTGDVNLIFSDLTDEQKASLKGKDGVSPTVTTSKTGSTATITITDVNGDHVFTLTDAGIETPVSVENGGTGATTAAQARENLGVTLDALGAAKADHTHSNYVSKSGDTMTGVLGMSSDSPMIQFTPTNQVNITSGYVATGADGTVYLQGTRPDGDYRVLHNNVAADDVSYGLTFTGTWGGAYAGYRVFHEGWTIPMANIPFKVAYGSVAASVVSGKQVTLDYSAVGFSSVPCIVANYATPDDNRQVNGFIKVFGKTTTSAKLTLSSGDATATYPVDWIAIGT